MLTEQEVAHTWSRLFKGQQVTDDVIEKAANLLDELRAESPLRHRLEMELSELREKIA